MGLKKSELKKLDDLWSSIIRQKGKCEFCGKTLYLNAHHYIGRRDFKLRWNVDNGFCLCSGCHTMSSIFSAHQTPHLFCEWARKVRGEDWENNLTKQHNHFGLKQQYDETLAYLQGFLK